MKRMFLLLFLLLLSSVAFGIPFTPSGDIDLKGVYGLKNGTTVNATKFYQNGTPIQNIYQGNITAQSCSGTDKVSSYASGTFSCSADRANSTEDMWRVITNGTMADKGYVIAANDSQTAADALFIKNSTDVSLKRGTFTDNVDLVSSNDFQSQSNAVDFLNSSGDKIFYIGALGSASGVPIEIYFRSMFDPATMYFENQAADDIMIIHNDSTEFPMGVDFDSTIDIGHTCGNMEFLTSRGSPLDLSCVDITDNIWNITNNGTMPTKAYVDTANQSVVNYTLKTFIQNRTNANLTYAYVDYLTVLNPPSACSNSGTFLTAWNGATGTCTAQLFNTTQDIFNVCNNGTMASKNYTDSNFIKNNTDAYLSKLGVGTSTATYELQTEKQANGNDVNLSDTVYVNSTTGYVGIGLRNATAQLQVKTNATTGDFSIFSIIGTQQYANNNIDMGTIGGAGAIWFGGVTTRRFRDLGTGSGGGLEFAAGSSTAEQLVFRGYNVTFNYHPSNTARVVFDLNNTKVGIGTTTPGQTLSVVGTFSVTNVSGTQGLYQDSNARVGIGTTTPTQTLDVNGSISIPTTNLTTGVGIIYQNGNRLLHTYGSGNLFIGTNSGSSLANGTGGNAGIGTNTLAVLTSGINNFAVGTNTLIALTTGGANTAIGAYSLTGLTTGSNNVGIGNAALLTITTGGTNTAVGEEAGRITATDSTGNVFIGYKAGYYETGSNKLYISNSNTMSPLILGDFNANALTFNGMVNITTVVTNLTTGFKVNSKENTSVLDVDTVNSRVGINTNAPTSTLHVIGNGNFTTDLWVNNAPVITTSNVTLYLKNSTDVSIMRTTINSTVTNTPLQVYGNQAGWIEIAVQNSNNNTNASSDLVATANNGDASSYYVNLGINSQNYSDSSWTSTTANGAYLYAQNASLTIGTTTAGKFIQFILNGSLISNIVGKWSASGFGIGTTSPQATFHNNGTTILQSATNSTTAVQIKSVEGTAILTVDTYNSSIKALAKLNVTGNVSFGGWVIFKSGMGVCWYENCSSYTYNNGTGIVDKG